MLIIYTIVGLMMNINPKLGQWVNSRLIQMVLTFGNANILKTRRGSNLTQL